MAGSGLDGKLSCLGRPKKPAPGFDLPIYGDRKFGGRSNLRNGKLSDGARLFAADLSPLRLPSLPGTIKFTQTIGGTVESLFNWVAANKRRCGGMDAELILCLPTAPKHQQAAMTGN